jgi:hypothetical protein
MEQHTFLEKIYFADHRMISLDKPQCFYILLTYGIKGVLYI